MRENNVSHDFAYPPIFEFREFDIITVTNVIRDLSPSASSGMDGIMSRLIKLGGSVIVPIITHICNLSINTKVFPSIWKTSKITPLHKTGDNSNPTNFRPISILPCMGKILEKLVHHQLYSYLDGQNLLSQQQSGFRKGYSTGTCLVNFLDEIFSGIDTGVPSGVLFIDLRKAFDTVDHSILLDKLHSYGLKSTAVGWFSS